MLAQAIFLIAKLYNTNYNLIDQYNTYFSIIERLLLILEAVIWMYTYTNK